jgi:hypothetical protein
MIGLGHDMPLYREVPLIAKSGGRKPRYGIGEDEQNEGRGLPEGPIRRQSVAAMVAIALPQNGFVLGNPVVTLDLMWCVAGTTMISGAAYV